jgi:hypothetical protein
MGSRKSNLKSDVLKSGSTALEIAGSIKENQQRKSWHKDRRDKGVRQKAS